MIRHSFEYFRPKQLAHFAEAVHSAKNVITRILEKLFEVFKIDDVRSYKKIANEFDDYFEELVSHGIVRCSSSASMDFLCPELLNINYKKVDLRYQKSVALGAADLRLFLSNRAMTLTPSRHTNNKSANSRPRTLDEPKSNFASHKVRTKTRRC